MRLFPGHSVFFVMVVVFLMMSLTNVVNRHFGCSLWLI